MLTITDVLVQAATTAKLCGESSEDRVWEFAYSTFVCDGDDDGFAFTINTLEEAFNDVARKASVAGKPIPDYILEDMQ